MVGFKENRLIFAYELSDGCFRSGACYKLDFHYIMEKRHTMLCRLADWNYHTRLQVNDNAEVDATGMLKHVPVVCVKANHAFNAHSGMYQEY